MKKMFGGWKMNIQKYFQSQGANLTFKDFEVISFKSQVVAGTNYSIIVKVNKSITLSVRIW